MPLPEREEYKRKIEIIGFDPYNRNIKFQSDFPGNLTMWNIFRYLIFKRSSQTGDFLHARKGMDGYEMAKNGWIKEAEAYETKDGIFIVRGRVFHSMRLNETPLKTWTAINSAGEVQTSHCDCVAGLGEVCSHVGALLFYTASIENVSCTSQQCLWNKKNPKTIANKKMSELFNQPPSNSIDTANITQTQEVEIPSFLNRIYEKGHISVVMKIVEPMASQISNKQESLVVDVEYEESFGHIFISRLFNTSHKEADLNDLVTFGDKIQLKMDPSEIAKVEVETRSQSSNSLWFKLRIGRVTASVFKDVCRTSIAHPSKTLLKKMCFPDTEPLKVRSLEYGRKTEIEALRKIKSQYKKQHANLEIQKVGLIVMENNTFYAASPDAIWTCNCHGKFCVEIKCPFRIKDSTELSVLLDSKNPFLRKDLNGQISLVKSHSYFYQIQLQMFILKMKMSLFYIYARNVQLLVQVEYDEEFMKEALKKSDEFILKVLKPQLLANYFYDPGQEY